MLTVGSLFAGIGGFDLGLERAGMRVVWQCEQDDFCRRVLARHWPRVPCHPDVRTLVADTQSLREPQRPLCEDEGGRGGTSDDSSYGVVPVPVPYVDVLCGGFPCQDISLAGKGAGIGGERSGLWGEYARLVRELRPRYVIVENVAALLTRGLDTVLADLAACGYDAEWDCLPASAFGAPHRRDRLWLIAYPRSVQHESQGDALRRQTAPRLPQTDVPDPNREGEHGLPVDAEVARPPEPVGDPDRLARAQTMPRLREPAAVAEPGPVERTVGSGGVSDADECALEPWRVGGRAAQAGGPEWWAVEPPVGRVAHGVPDRLDQLAALGNALVPQIAEWLGRRILEWERGVAA